MSNDKSSMLRLLADTDSELLELNRVKEYLRIEHANDDDVIAAAITATRQLAQHYLQTSIFNQTWEYTVANPECKTITLPMGPARQITGVSFIDQAGVVTSPDAGAYRLSVDGCKLWFDHVLQTEKLKITYRAGLYETIENVPRDLLQGLLYHIETIVENRDGTVGLPLQTLNFYQPYRQVRV